MFVHKALIDALSTKKFKTTSSQIVKKCRNTGLITEEFQVSFLIPNLLMRVYPANLTLWYLSFQLRGQKTPA